MNPQLISRMERTALLLGIVTTALCGLMWKVPGMVAAGVGALLGSANFRGLHFLGRRVLSKAQSGEGSAKAGGLVMLLMAKMGLLFACVWIALAKFGLMPIPFALGISAFVASILGVGLLSAPAQSAEEAKTHG